MQRKELELFFEEFNPDENGKVLRSAIFASYQARTGADLDTALAALPETARLPPGQQSVDRLRGRRRRDWDLQQVPEQGRTSLPVATTSNSILRPDTSVTASAILAPSAADRRADAAGAAGGNARLKDSKEDRISFKAFRAIVDGANQPGAEDQEDLPVVEMAGGSDSGQVELRTPPAMERNLFLSALANGKLEHHRGDVVTTLKRVVAGGLAGMLAKSVVAPVDRVKILFQVTNEKFSFKKAEKLFQDILALEGPAGLWKGNSATMIRVFPYAGTQFMMFDSLKRWALLRKTRRDPNAEQRLSNIESLMSGSFAGATSALVTYPLDLARARLAVGHSRKVGGARRRSMGVPELLRNVVRKEGAAALYRGITPSLMGIIPYAGIAFSINEQAKHEVVILTGKEPGTIHKLGIGAFAGLIAQSCTYPLEVTRRRMQTHGHVDTHAGVNKVFEVPKAGMPPDVDAMRRLNIFQTLTTVFKEQGVGGLFKGLSMNWVKGPVGISISFTTFDFLKRRFGIS